MKRDDSCRETKVCSRRAFCAGGVAVIGLGACGGADGRIGVGSLDGNADLAHVDNGPKQDLSTRGEDLSEDAQPDMAKSGSCSGTVDAGAATAIVAGSPKYVSNMYVCRDSGGLYAMSSACTHQGCKLTSEATEFYCNCHGATFDLNGQNPTSPAHSPLNHYALCVNTSGNIEVDPSQIVDPSTRG